MKRENSKYQHVAGGDIYNHYGLVFWQECFFCNKEFRREKGFRFQMRYNSPWSYSCTDCSDSKDAVDQNVKRFFAARPKAPPAPPRKR